jgi:2-amino-4-hydroxy-6-hydroxymethyldihydropteridine diphosphokinase
MVGRSSLRKALACRVQGGFLRERTYFLGLGSNLGDRRRNLLQARKALEKAGVKVLRASSVYRTEPVEMTDQPWFLNQVLKVETNLTPQELLSLAKSIELRMKRVRTEAKGPRTIDIDILLAGEAVVDTPELTIPHPRLALRNFVLVPLREIAPRAIHPVLRKTVAELSLESSDTAAVVRDERRPSRKR